MMFFFFGVNDERQKKEKMFLENVHFGTRRA